MTKLEHTFRTLGKFLAMTSALKVMKEFYGEDIPKDKLMTILNELGTISDDYLYPKYILKRESAVLDEADYENCRVESDNMIPEKQDFEITLFNNDYKADSLHIDTTIYDDVDGY